MLPSGNILHTVHTGNILHTVHTDNILHTVHTACQPTLQHHNSYNRTDNYRQWNAVGSPDDGRKDARNMFRYYWLPINHYLLHLVGFSFIYLSKMHGRSNIKLMKKGCQICFWREGKWEHQYLGNLPRKNRFLSENRNCCWQHLWFWSYVKCLEKLKL